MSVSLWGLSVSEIAVTASAVFAGLSFLVHLWLSVRRDRREQEKARRESARHALILGDVNNADAEATGSDAPRDI